MAKFNKDDVVIYLGNIPYILADGQRVDKSGDKITLRKNLDLKDDIFKLDINIDKLHEEALKENEAFDKEKLAKKEEENKRKEEENRKKEDIKNAKKESPKG